jgi:GTP cyclohydrolase II
MTSLKTIFEKLAAWRSYRGAVWELSQLTDLEANHALGFKADCRDFSLPAAILLDLGVKRVRLLSNNPRKASALVENDIQVVEQLACEAAPNRHSFDYLRAKKEKMGHTLSSWQCEGTHNSKHSLRQRSCPPKSRRPLAFDESPDKDAAARRSASRS